MGYLTEGVNSSRTRNVDKWVAMGMMQRIEEVRSVAEMLSATMEDLSDQMTDLESNLDYLTGATETIQDKIEEMVFLIENEISPEQNCKDGGLGAATVPELSL